MQKKDWEILELLKSQGYSGELVSENGTGIIDHSLAASAQEITGLELLSKGMTNHLMSFYCRGKRYFMRLPGEGANQMIDRFQEESVYRAISGRDISDHVVYIDAASGYKISEFIEGGYTCGDRNEADIKRCFEHLKRFHEMKLSVEHRFNPFDKAEYYRTLWDEPSMFPDYEAVKAEVFSLQAIIDRCPKEECLCHIDSVCDNFLLTEERVYLIDWEYAGMCDPHIDIAMFAIYSGYSKEELDHLIDLYFDGNCDDITRLKIYCYVAASGFLWAVWCDYKKYMGVDFGEYTMVQYRYAKDFGRLAKEMAKKLWKEGEDNETS